LNLYLGDGANSFELAGELEPALGMDFATKVFGLKMSDNSKTSDGLLVQALPIDGEPSAHDVWVWTSQGQNGLFDAAAGKLIAAGVSSSVAIDLLGLGSDQIVYLQDGLTWITQLNDGKWQEPEVVPIFPPGAVKGLTLAEIEGETAIIGYRWFDGEILLSTYRAGILSQKLAVVEASWQSAPAVGDIDGDGTDELLFFGFNSEYLSWGPEGWICVQPISKISLAKHPRNFVAADLDGDGDEEWSFTMRYNGTDFHGRVDVQPD